MDVVVHRSPNKHKAIVVKLWHILGVLCKKHAFLRPGHIKNE